VAGKVCRRCAQTIGIQRFAASTPGSGCFVGGDGGLPLPKTPEGAILTAQPSGDREMSVEMVAGVSIPDSKLAQEVAELVKDTEPQLLFHHSSRVYYWGALTGRRHSLRFDPELLYAGAMFHDMGLTPQYASADKRFEVDGANAARDFLKSHSIAERDIETVWTAIALHTTPGIPQYMHPVVALLTAGVEMDVLGIAFSEFSDAEREAVVRVHPRPGHFKEEIIQAFYDGIRRKPATTFGNVKADVLADKDLSFRPINFCEVIRSSAWPG
jgi:HD domain